MTKRTLRKRRSLTNLETVDSEEENKEDPSVELPNYMRLGNNVYRVRGNDKDSWMCTMLEVFGIIFVFSLVYYSYYHYDNLHFHVSHGYAHMGYSSAQHVVGQRYLAGRGTDKNETLAMQWFKSASDQGHPEASYNLAVGHMQGAKTELKRGDSEKLLRFAAEKGVDAALHALQLCARRGCD